MLNGLETVPVPPELSQRAKCFQTVVRLGTYTGKVPMYNSLACKGAIILLLRYSLARVMLTGLQLDTQRVMYIRCPPDHYDVCLTVK